MRKVLFLAFVCLPLFAKSPAKIVSDTEHYLVSDTLDMSSFKTLIDAAMNRALSDATQELRKRGHVQEADEIQSDWDFIYGGSFFTNSRNIGDHKPINQWVSDKYQYIETILGRSFCIETHIAAIKTFNSGIPVVIHPCTFPMDNVPGEKETEYRRNFAGHSVNVADEPYEGVAPEVVYFACEIACMAGTSGIGSFICSAGASIGEKLMATFVAPRLSDRIYEKACLGVDIGDY